MRDALLTAPRNTVLNVSKRAVDIATDLSKLISENECIHNRGMRKHARNGVAASLFGIGIIAIATLSFLKARDEHQKTKQWKETDKKLDEALAEPLDASDAVASY